MKRINICLMLIILSIISQPAIAQKQEVVFKATITNNTTKLIKIEFSENISENMEYYEVVGNNKTIMFGESKLMNSLHYEPGLLAFRVIIDKKIMTLEFTVKQPEITIRSEIINRVIKMTQSLIMPNSRLELDGYDPILGLDLTRDGKKVPPPIFTKKALPSGSKPI